MALPIDVLKKIAIYSTNPEYLFRYTPIAAFSRSIEPKKAIIWDLKLIIYKFTNIFGRFEHQHGFNRFGRPLILRALFTADIYEAMMKGDPEDSAPVVEALDRLEATGLFGPKEQYLEKTANDFKEILKTYKASLSEMHDGMPDFWA